MKRLMIICEGPTEVEFCKHVLYNYFLSKNILIATPLIKKSAGGIVHWLTLRKQIENHFSEKDVYVTTFIDYYGLKPKHAFPRWDDAITTADKEARMDILERAMLADVAEKYRPRFIPYLQLHEFEGLLFNNIEVFDLNFHEWELKNRHELHEIITSHPNPELINDTEINAPSIRLKRLIYGYSKVSYGSSLAESIGLERIRAKSKRFNAWIERLSSI